MEHSHEHHDHSHEHHKKSFNWKATAITFIVISVILLYFAWFNLSHVFVTKSSIGVDLVNYLNEQAPAPVALQKVSSENGLYKVDVSFQGETVTLYASKDGKLFGSLQPLTADDSNTDTDTLPIVDASEDDDPSTGDENAPVTIIEFSDFQCPFCQRFYQQTLPLIEENYVKTGKVRIVFRDFPLGFHQNAQKSAEAAECADDQGKFWQYHDLLFEKGSGDGTGLAVVDLKKYAQQLGLNVAMFNNCLDSGKYANEVAKDLADGTSYGVSGTPAFFVNGNFIEGAQPYSAFQEVIDAELAKV